MTSRRAIDVVQRAGALWSQHKIFQLSAALAYYSIFSIAPLLVIVIALAGWAFGTEAVRGHLGEELRTTIGQSAADTVQSMVKSAYQPGRGIWATTLGLLTLLFGATGVFGQLKDSLNTIWDVRPDSSVGITAFLRERLISFGLVLAIGFLMLTSLILTSATAAVWDYLSALLPLPKVLLGVAGVLVSFAITTTLFALMFKWLPDTPVAWCRSWPGAAFTAGLFEIGKLLLAIYLGRESTASSYGPAGAVVLVLLWVNYASMIFLSGACFTRACGEGTRSPD